MSDYRVEQFSTDAVAVTRDGDDILHLSIVRGDPAEGVTPATDAELQHFTHALEQAAIRFDKKGKVKA